MKKILRLLALCAAVAAVTLIPSLLHQNAPEARLPGAEEPPRQLLRIWVTGAPGGGLKWLQAQLTAFERTHAGVSCYVRQVSPDMLSEPPSPPPDVVLFMPGDLTAPENLLLPLSGALQGEESLLRAGRWQGLQYAQPLCWSAWVLAVDSQYDDILAATPAPTTLLGRPAPTPEAPPTATPGFPLEKIQAAAVPLMAPQGAGLFTLPELTGGVPPMDSAESSAVYEAFVARKAASALLTTGQLTAFRGLQAAGRGFPCRVLVPREIITDLVWMAGVARSSPAVAALLAHLTGEKAQRSLASQGLYPISTGLPLYGDGAAAQVEAAARRSLTAVNAFLPTEKIRQAAWQVCTGHAALDDALTPLL